MDTLKHFCSHPYPVVALLEDMAVHFACHKCLMIMEKHQVCATAISNRKQDLNKKKKQFKKDLKYLRSGRQPEGGKRAARVLREQSRHVHCSPQYSDQRRRTG